MFSDQDWKTLNELINSLKKLSKYLDNDRRLYHYLERIYFYTSRALEREQCKNVFESLTDVFPKVINFDFFC